MSTNSNIINKCPKCQSSMVEHPSSLSMPLRPSQTQNATNDLKKMNIEDQDANFIFNFNSCKKCGYSEFYLKDGGGRI